MAADLGYAGGPAPLDVESLLATVTGEAPSEQVGEGLRMGHLHLHGGDVDEGLAFYRDVLGFEERANPAPPPSWRPAATTTTWASTSGAATASGASGAHHRPAPLDRAAADGRRRR